MFKTYFEINAEARLLEGEEALQMQASLAMNKDLFTEIHQDEDSDMLAIIGNLYVPGLPNKNGDYISIEDGLKYYKTFRNKFIDLEHKRSVVVGFIYDVFLTSYPDNKIIEESDVINEAKPFNVAIKAYLWKKTMGEDLTNYITRTSGIGAQSSQSVSLSLEYSFYEYKHAIWEEGKLIEIPEEKQEEYSQYALHNKGTGFDKNKKRVVRYIKGEQVGSGAGIVGNPGGLVKGIIVLNKDDNYTSNTANNSPVSTQEVKNSVIKSSKPKKFMFKTIEDLKASWNEVKETPDELFASISSFIAESIKEKSIAFEDSLKKESQAKEEAAKNAERLQSLVVANESKIKDYEEQIAKFAYELKQLKEAQEAAAKQEIFNTRMSDFDANYDLDDDDRKFIQKDLVCMESEEQYASYKEKMGKLMKEKSKAYKESVKAKAKTVLAEKNIEAKLDGSIEDIFASLVVTNQIKSVTNGIEPNTNHTLKSDLVSAFKNGTVVSVNK